ncbi:unnamed protein product [Heligmosomoides polygyrus]|uniref:DHC_N2 domain-containing protein n=1 Tax=Heligmosomoides polygyrus TaxID=6339 RepID=A0A183GKW8_HELPZ|nr:unnamed protein product [Heligmosomoides polygyrus]
MMDEIRKSGMMESILNPVDNEVLRKLFETELMNPSSRDVRLLHEALNKLWEEVMCNLMKFSFEQESLVLLCEREKVKTRFLDVMLICPQNLPDCWGRRHMCATVEKSTIQQMLKSFHRDSVSVIPSPIAQSVTSQWTKHMKDIVDEKTKTQEAPMRKQLIEIDEVSYLHNTTT